ncbi:MAG: copper amine oxidase N-terminal domain-containing protein [Desulfotomaculaceae bacterium]|nr:copper amine oxidase N-terminal domain-containing protein [Desulfotomaculaceae bacterium]
MLRILWLTTALCLLFAAPAVAETPAYALVVNGMTVYSDVPLSVDGFRVLVPLRVVAEATGANVQYLEQEREVIITRPGLVVVLKLDSYSFTKNGAAILLITPPQLINDSTFVTREQLVAILDVNAYLNIPDHSFIVQG